MSEDASTAVSVLREVLQDIASTQRLAPWGARLSSLEAPSGRDETPVLSLDELQHRRARWRMGIRCLFPTEKRGVGHNHRAEPCPFGANGSCSGPDNCVIEKHQAS